MDSATVADMAVGGTRVGVLLARAKGFRATGQYEDGVECAREALTVLDLVTHVSPDVGAEGVAANLMAELLMLCGRYGEADTHLRRALAIREAVEGFGSRNVAETVHNMARLAGYKGRYDEAESLFQRAVDIREGALGVSCLEVAETLNAWGELLLRRLDIPRAELQLRRAWAIWCAMKHVQRFLDGSGACYTASLRPCRSPHDGLRRRGDVCVAGKKKKGTRTRRKQRLCCATWGNSLVSR